MSSVLKVAPLGIPKEWYIRKTTSNGWLYFNEVCWICATGLGINLRRITVVHIRYVTHLKPPSEWITDIVPYNPISRYIIYHKFLYWAEKWMLLLVRLHAGLHRTATKQCYKCVFTIIRNTREPSMAKVSSIYVTWDHTMDSMIYTRLIPGGPL